MSYEPITEDDKVKIMTALFFGFIALMLLADWKFSYHDLGGPKRQILKPAPPTPRLPTLGGDVLDPQPATPASCKPVNPCGGLDHAH